MKNHIFLLFSIISFSSFSYSCSSDDNSDDNNPNQPSSLTVTINGIPKTFNTIVVSESILEQTEFLNITATIDNDPTEIIYFTVIAGMLGTDTFGDFYYKNLDLQYVPYFPGTYINHFITTNSNGKLEGTFNAKLINASAEYIELTNGQFEIYY